MMATMIEINRDTIRRELQGEHVLIASLHSRLCRRDAVGRLSKRDSEDIERVVAQMLADGEVEQSGDFLRLPRRARILF